MANQPIKADPTEAALSAIADAINARDAETRNVPPSEPQAPPAPPVVADLFHDQPDTADWSKDVPPVKRAANDDRAAMGAMLHALQNRTRRTAYVVAGVFAALWLIGGGAVAYLYRGEIATLLAEPGAGLVPWLAIGAGFLIPVFFAYAIAHMLARAADLRLIAQTMAEVAMRLAEPEVAAKESVVTVGHAIRREVAAMGDGVERALARAAELEALVHNEVAALERAYNDNEVRIRVLLTELAAQRDQLVVQAERVRTTISSTHQTISQDLNSIGDVVAEKVNDVAQRITRTLTEKGEHITLALGHAGDSMIDALGERGGNLLDRLESTSEKTSGAIRLATDQLTGSLDFKTDKVRTDFNEIATSVQQLMASRMEQAAQNFAQHSTGMIDLMASRSQEMSEAIVHAGSRTAQDITGRIDEIKSSLQAAGETLVL
ncbi:MAG: hypothetical protein AB7U62_19115, partial [Pseudolabrys sp.]